MLKFVFESMYCHKGEKGKSSHPVCHYLGLSSAKVVVNLICRSIIMYQYCGQNLNAIVFSVLFFWDEDRVEQEREGGGNEASYP